MNNDQEFQSHETIVDLVKDAKHRPLPKSTKALFLFVSFALVFTGGIAYGKQKATQSGGAALSLSGLSGGGGFGQGGFGGGRNRNGGASSSVTGAIAGTDPTSGFVAGPAVVAAADVAGTVVSVDAKSVVVATLSGGNETFPITDSTKVRTSSRLDLGSIKPGDIVTIKPDDAKAAKTITVVN